MYRATVLCANIPAHKEVEIGVLLRGQRQHFSQLVGYLPGRSQIVSFNLANGDCRVPNARCQLNLCKTQGYTAHLQPVAKREIVVHQHSFAADEQTLCV
jgi:hypothetical protein